MSVNWIPVPDQVEDRFYTGMTERIMKYKIFIGLAGIILLHLWLLSKITFFPYPEFFVYSYLTKAGLVPYTQIIDQHFPGLVFFPVNLATLGIDTVFEYHIIQLCVVFISHILLWLIGRKLFKSNLYALISNLLFLIWQPFFEGYVLWIDSFCALLLLGAFYFLIRKVDVRSEKMENEVRGWKWDYFMAGFLLGLSLLLKQVVAPLIVVVGIYLLYKERSIKKVLEYAIGILIPVGYLLYWVTSLGIWQDFWYWSVTFNTTTFAQMGRTYPSVGQVMRIGPVFGVAVLSAVGIVIARSETTWQSLNVGRLLRFARNYRLLLLMLFFFGALFFAYARFDYVHLQPALVFAILIVVNALSIILAHAGISKDKDTYLYRFPIRKSWFFKLKSGMTLVALLYLVGTMYLLLPFYRFHWGGDVRFFGGFEKQVSEKVLHYANPGDSTFALGTTPHLYYLTQTLPPGRVFVFQFPWFMLEAEDRILEGIKNDPPKVVVRDKSAEVGEMKLVDYMKDIDSYIEETYRVIDEVDGTEIMIRK
jgi:hypothetical protein